MNIEESILIWKYLLEEATEEEIKTLFDWIDTSPKNKEEFIAYKKVWALSIDSKAKNDIDWNEIQAKIKALKNKKRISLALRYAAVLVLGAFITTTFFIYRTVEENSNEIVLELHDGTKKIISIGANQDIINYDGSVLGKQQKSKISYENTGIEDSEELKYNTLYVPYAKRFHLVLSDGSSIHLNSGTTIRFPVKFLKGLPREVFLNGEAFFDVSEDKKHAFIVQANGLSTHVYGTKFNVNSYKNDDVEDVVLLEGSVGVQAIGKQSNISEELMLKPNEIVSLNNSGKIFKQSVDVKSHVVWIDGVLIFENERLEIILKKLERHYDVSIQNNHAVFNDNRYTGIFDIETIDEVLMSLSKIKPFTYRINDKKIIINP